jgi:hypothetical protein
MTLPANPTTLVTEEVLHSSSVAIEGVTEAVILRYFETLNAREFGATSRLFAENGVLQAPFEQPIVGRGAIAAYLEQEAKGFMLRPRQGTVQVVENGCREFQIVGMVQTPLFSVNVSWLFALSPRSEISLAKTKLLASMQELWKLKKN